MLLPNRRCLDASKNWMLWRWRDIFCKAGLYLRRLYLFCTPVVRVTVHWMHEPDSAAHHDHPAPFLSIVLRGGYVEEVARYWSTGVRSDVRLRRVRWLNFKHAADAHAIREITPGTVTLVIWGRKQRSWGFWVSEGGLSYRWVHWTQYDEEGRALTDGGRRP